MLLDARLEAEAEVVGEAVNFAGRTYYELRLVSEDGQTLHLFEGQLKEIPGVAFEPGKRYRLTFRPFVNNRWLELKLSGVEPL